MKIFKRSVVWVLLWGLMFNLGCQKSNQGKTYVIHPGDNDQYELQNRLINAVPGDVIQLEKGIYTFNTELSVVEDNITIRGRGHEDTILSFKDQEIGSEGIRVTGNAFVIENLAVEDTIGNAIKVLILLEWQIMRIQTQDPWMIAPEHGSMSIARTVIAPEDQLEVPASIYNTDSRIWKSWVFGNHLLRPVEVPGGAYTILFQGNLSNPS